MTDPQESYAVPDPTIVDPCPVTVWNGQCAPDGFTDNHHPQVKSPGQPESFATGQEMKITDSVEGEGNFTYLSHVYSFFCEKKSNFCVCF